jgi:hypothetical protein
MDCLFDGLAIDCRFDGLAMDCLFDGLAIDWYADLYGEKFISSIVDSLVD